jgi:3-dehydroquinate dehydratase
MMEGNDKLKCFKCGEIKHINHFTRFERNPVLKAERNGYAKICRDCCNEYVQENDNSLKALREILVMQDIPYIQRIADMAVKLVKTKKKTGKAGIQNTLYNAYCSKISLSAKGYINASFSDEIRTEEMESKADKTIGVAKDIKVTEEESAKKFLIKTFNEQIYNDIEKLSKAVELKMTELSLSNNDNLTRQNKFRLKNAVAKLCDANILDRKKFGYLFGEEVVEENKEKEPIGYSDEEIKILSAKWGEGYSSNELMAFERKYQLLKNNYPEKTALHTEALQTYVRYRVKEEMATAIGDVKSAKDWGDLASKQAQNAKLNVAQLSKSDLTLGLDTFGQLVRAVETAVDVIPILPQFKEKPQDKVDFTLLCYINYIRDLKGLPPAEYKEIYRFYEERKKEYESRFDFLQSDMEDEEVKEGEED